MKIKDYGDIPDKCPPSSRRHGIMLCQPMEEKRFIKWGEVAIAQPKLDGERCRAIVEGNNVTLISSEENRFVSVPHVESSLLKGLGGILTKRIEIDGELYNHSMSFEEIHGVVSRTANRHPDYQQIRFYAFDLVNGDIQVDRIRKLHSLMKEKLLGGDITMVHSEAVCCMDDLMKFYNESGDMGFEGIVLRHPGALYERKRSLYMMKFKPKKSDDYEVVGYVEEVDKNGSPKERLGSLRLRGEDGAIFGVGSGLTDSDRESLWADRENLYGRICRVSYQHRTKGGVPRFPVYVELYEKGTIAKTKTPEGFRFG